VSHTERQALLLTHLHKVPASLHTFTKSPQVYTHCVTHRETSLALGLSSQSPRKSTHIHNVPTSLHTLCHTQRETSLALEPSSQSPRKSTHIHYVPTSLHTLCHTQAYCIALYFNSILLYCVVYVPLDNVFNKRILLLLLLLLLWKCMAESSGNLPGPLHATRTLHMPAKTLPSPVIKSTCLLRVRHYLQRGRSISPILWGCCNANAKC